MLSVKANTRKRGSPSTSVPLPRSQAKCEAVAALHVSELMQQDDAATLGGPFVEARGHHEDRVQQPGDEGDVDLPALDQRDAIPGGRGPEQDFELRIPERFRTAHDGARAEMAAQRPGEEQRAADGPQGRGEQSGV